jgi:large subunit ribosomal protein L34
MANIFNVGQGVQRLMKRTLRGSKSKAKKGSGFLARMSSKSGQKVIKARRAKGRQKIAI